MNNSLSLDFYQLDMQCLQLEMSLFESFVITEANELDIRRDFSNSSSTKPKDIKKENAFKTMIKKAVDYLRHIWDDVIKPFFKKIIDYLNLETLKRNRELEKKIDSLSKEIQNSNIEYVTDYDIKGLSDYTKFVNDSEISKQLSNKSFKLLFDSKIFELKLTCDGNIPASFIIKLSNEIQDINTSNLDLQYFIYKYKNMLKEQFSIKTICEDLFKIEWDSNDNLESIKQKISDELDIAATGNKISVNMSDLNKVKELFKANNKNINNFTAVMPKLDKICEVHNKKALKFLENPELKEIDQGTGLVQLICQSVQIEYMFYRTYCDLSIHCFKNIHGICSKIVNSLKPNNKEAKA